MQSQKVVTAYFEINKLLPLSFTEHHIVTRVLTRSWFITRDPHCSLLLAVCPRSTITSWLL